jgi:1-acyl-sn-glycerol-3-phosphate acyltransferase
VEIMPSVDTSGYSKERVRELSEHCRHLMLAKIEQLDAEIARQAQPAATNK